LTLPPGGVGASGAAGAFAARGTTLPDAPDARSSALGLGVASRLTGWGASRGAGTSAVLLITCSGAGPFAALLTLPPGAGLSAAVVMLASGAGPFAALGLGVASRLTAWGASACAGSSAVLVSEF